MARLADEILKESFLRLLKQRNIVTVTDFLQEDVDKIARVTKLPFKDILQIRHHIMLKFSSLCISGLEGYSNLVTNSAILPTGIKSFDKILSGGLHTGSVFEICGQSGAGKTQLCFTIALNVSHHLNQTVYYIDSKNDFSASRIQEVLMNKGYSELVCRAILEHVVVIKVKNIYQLLLFLNNLKTVLSRRNTRLCRLIIVDSIPVFYFPFIGGANTEGLGFLNSVMTTMKYISTKYFVIFCVVNIATLYKEGDNSGTEDCLELQTDTEEVRPMLGKYWLHTPSTRCLIQKCIDNLSRRTIKIVKSTHLQTGVLCTVEVSDLGIT